MKNQLINNDNLYKINACELKMYKKGYYKELNILMEKLYKNGVEFYSITQTQIVDTGKYASYALVKEKIIENAWEHIEASVYNFINLTLTRIPFIEFVYLSIEKHEGEGILKGYPHFHCIFGISPIVGGIGESLYTKIKEEVNYGNYKNSIDRRVNYLRSLSDVINSMNYVIKEFKLNKHYFYKFVNSKKTSKFIEYYNTFEKFMELRPPNLETVKLKENKIISRLNDLDLILHTTNERIFSEVSILNLINIYMQLEEIIYNKGGFYKKIKQSKSSYNFVEKFENLIGNFRKILVRILEEPILRYQLEYSDLYPKIIKLLNSGKQVVLKDPEFSLNIIDINTKICEFKDGFYFMEFDIFASYEKYGDIIENLINLGKLNTNKYYNITYHNIETPNFWLECISNNLVNNKQDLENFCIDFGMLLHKKSVGSKKKDNLYIEGESNTGKTTLVSNVLMSIYGEENIGIIGVSDRFQLEQAVEKMILLCDEFVYKRTMRSDLLKLMDNSPVLVEKKYKTGQIQKSNARGLFLANPGINEEFLVDKAIQTRLTFYKFRNAQLLNDPVFIRKVQSEIPKILVYCNKKYLKSIKFKRFRIGKYLKKLHIKENILSLGGFNKELK